MKSVAIVGYEDSVKNYVAALRAVELEPVVTLEPGRAMDCAGLLLPGGGDIAPARFGQPDQGSRDIDLRLDEVQLTALDGFVRTGRPVLGICRGHQVLGVYFGGDLIQDLPTARTHMAHDHVDSVHPITVRPRSLLQRFWGLAPTVNSSHHQGIGRLAGGLRAAALAPDGVIEAVEHESLPILGVQFHPERMAFAHARPDTADGAAVFRWFRQTL